jgi:hypothetical protein
MKPRLHDSLDNIVRSDAFIVRATEMGQFLNCPRSWMFMSHNGLNLEDKIRPSKLRFGIVWHSALEAVYNGEDPFKAIDEGFIKEATDIFGLDASDPLIQEQIEREKELAKILMQGYMTWRLDVAVPSDKELTVVDAERRMLLPLDGTRAYLAVRLDTEVLDKNGGLWIIEHKSRGKSSNVEDPPELDLDLQLSLQLYALKNTTDMNVRGAIYNLTRKQAPSNRVKSAIYARHKLVRSNAEIDGIEITLRNAYYDMRRASNLVKSDPVEAMLNLRYNPQPYGLCGWGCSVKDICQAINRREDVEYLIESKLKPRDKNIWEVLEEELAED